MNLTANDTTTPYQHPTVSPKDSGGGTSAGGCSVDINSNGTPGFPTGSPEVKGSITSRSDICYPVIDHRSKILESFQNRKIIRFLTVIAYIFSVSLAAIVLSFYYFFLWDPHMEARVVPEGFTPQNPLGPPSLLGDPMDSFRAGRHGRRKIAVQHPINHYPLEASGFRIPPPSPDSMAFPVPTVKPDLDEGDTSNCENTSSSLDSTPNPQDDGQRLGQMPRPTGEKREFLPTVPSLYSLIVRRFADKKMSSSNFVSSPPTHFLASS